MTLTFPFRTEILRIAYAASPERRTQAALGWAISSCYRNCQDRRLASAALDCTGPGRSVLGPAHPVSWPIVTHRDARWPLRLG